MGPVALALVGCLVSVTPPAESQSILRSVGFDQHIGTPLRLDVAFRDESGATIRLRDCFEHGKPVVLAPVYYRCPMLCTLVLNGLLRGLRHVQFDVGEEFEIVVVSIDPKETPALAAAKKSEYVRQYGRDASERGWHFLTGDEASIRSLTEDVGFRYTFDPATGQFAHASGVVVVTPEGVVSRYLFGVEYAPRDLRLGLVEAAAGKIGSLVDQVLLICFHYDPSNGRYGLAIVTVLRIVGGATVVLLFAFVLRHLRRERRRARS